MTPEELAAIKARALAWPRPCGVCMGHSPERDGHTKGCDVPIIREDMPALIAALRQAWAVLDAASVVQDDLVRQRDLAQITMAEDAGRRIMDLTAEVERLRELFCQEMDWKDDAQARAEKAEAAIARVRARCDEADHSGRHVNGYGYVLLRPLLAAVDGEA